MLAVHVLAAAASRRRHSRPLCSYSSEQARAVTWHYIVKGAELRQWSTGASLHVCGEHPGQALTFQPGRRSRPASRGRACAAQHAASTSRSQHGAGRAAGRMPAAGLQQQVCAAPGGSAGPLLLLRPA